MKVLGSILNFFISPFTVLLNMDFKGVESKHKWVRILIYVLVSLLVSALVVYLSHKTIELVELRK